MFLSSQKGKTAMEKEPGLCAIGREALWSLEHTKIHLFLKKS